MGAGAMLQPGSGRSGAPGLWLGHARPCPHSEPPTAASNCTSSCGRHSPALQAPSVTHPACEWL